MNGLTRGRAGAASIEWVGLLVVCGALVLALLVAAPGWGGALGGKVSAVVCAVTDGRCPAAGSAGVLAGTRPGVPKL